MGSYKWLADIINYSYSYTKSMIVSGSRAEDEYIANRKTTMPIL